MKSILRNSALDPTRVTQTLHDLRDSLATALGDELISIFIFGDFVRANQFDSAHSKINLMLIVERIDCDLLDKMTGSINKAEKKIPLATMTLTQEDLVSSCDVFPVKFHDIQQHHALLYGQDLVSDLEISDEHLRLRCEQELKNLMIRLRASYLHRSHSREQLLKTLLDSTHSFLNNVNACLLIKTGIVPQDDGDVMDEFGDEFKLNVVVVREILVLQKNQQTPSLEDLKRIYNSFMSLIHDAAQTVDQMETNQ